MRGTIQGQREMIKPFPITYGTDPEGFFKRRGEIIGSEHVIPEQGFAGAIRDGVQFELNPPAARSVRDLAVGISTTFQALRQRLRQYPGVEFHFGTLVDVSRKELDALSPNTRVLGCMPSYNAYGDRPITVDASVYTKRSAGGHVHVGIVGSSIYRDNGLVDERQRLAPYFDVFVGSPSVMLDRDPGAVERRENYGRAGEYRLPEHGFEYRTTSNFWLRGYPLMSFVFGMANLAAAAFHAELTEGEIEETLGKAIEIPNVIEAIDKNDFGTALINFGALYPFFDRHVPKGVFPIDVGNFDKFCTFAKDVYANGLDKYFPETTIVDRWCNLEFVEFREFLDRV